MHSQAGLKLLVKSYVRAENPNDESVAGERGEREE